MLGSLNFPHANDNNYEEEIIEDIPVSNGKSKKYKKMKGSFPRTNNTK